MNNSIDFTVRIFYDDIARMGFILRGPPEVSMGYDLRLLLLDLALPLPGEWS
jgi:hypothetical protein